MSPKHATYISTCGKEKYWSFGSRLTGGFDRVVKYGSTLSNESTVDGSEIWLPSKKFISHEMWSWYRATVDGRNPATVEVGRLSHHLQGFIYLRWWSPDFWNINSTLLPMQTDSIRLFMTSRPLHRGWFRRVGKPLHRSWEIMGIEGTPQSYPSEN